MITLSVQKANFSFTPRSVNLSKGYPLKVDASALFGFTPGNVQLTYSNVKALRAQTTHFRFYPREAELRWGTYNFQVTKTRFRFVPRSVEFAILEGHKLSVSSRRFRFYPNQVTMSTLQAHPLSRPPRIFIKVM